jgi:hypothetical protein
LHSHSNEADLGSQLINLRLFGIVIDNSSQKKSKSCNTQCQALAVQKLFFQDEFLLMPLPKLVEMSELTVEARFEA